MTGLRLNQAKVTQEIPNTSFANSDRLAHRP